MVASIALPSGTLPELSNAIFAPGCNDQLASLFDASMAAIAQGNESQGQDASTPASTEPAASVPPAASLFPFPPAIQVSNLVFPTGAVANSEPTEVDQDSGYAPATFQAPAGSLPLAAQSLLPPG